MDGFNHVPVLLAQVRETLAGTLRDGASPRVLVDLTLGGAGHTRALAEEARPDLVVGFDRDADALAAARARLADLPCRIETVHAPFSTVRERLADLGIHAVTVLLADIGVSSHQLDTGSRGFSFRAHAPLDMRMDASRGATAAERIAAMGVPDLARVLREYGEEPDARRIAQAVIAAAPTTTDELARTVEGAMSARQRRALGTRIHPATRTFQALRILVNDELGELDRILEDGPELLAPGGRMGVISFHSLEDRRVKQRFRALSRPPELPRGLPVTAAEMPKARFAMPRRLAQGLTADEQELTDNPRARSARLRVLERPLEGDR